MTPCREDFDSLIIRTAGSHSSRSATTHIGLGGSFRESRGEVCLYHLAEHVTTFVVRFLIASEDGTRQTLLRIWSWGLRVYGYGYHVGIIDVDTYEESPRKLLRNLYEGGWANQRTRWVRGMIYTVTRLGRYWGEFSLRRRSAIAFLLLYYLLALVVPFIPILGYPFMVISVLAMLLMQMRYKNEFEQIAKNPILASFMQNKWLATLGTINMLLLLWTIFLTIRGIDETVGKAIKRVRTKLYYYGLAACTIMFYWVLWGLPVLRAIWQIMRRADFWEKTFHEGLHHPVLDELKAPLRN